VLNIGTTIAFEATFTLFPSPNQQPPLKILLQLYQQHSKLLINNKEMTILVPQVSIHVLQPLSFKLFE
jgi:hypothetical protein